MNKIVLFVLMLLMGLKFQAQDHFTYFCGQVAAQEKLYQLHPQAVNDMRQATADLENYTQEYMSDRGGDDVVYTIPVVFHIIHQNGPENISDDQIHDALAILTRDFRKQNADSSIIVSEFQDIASDCRIEFRLATIDPDGNCHTGINRISSPLTYTGSDNNLKSLSYWPRDSYMNVWVVSAIGDNVAGFTNQPGDVASNWAAGDDGIVVRSDYTGSIGTSSVAKSRTLTHEVGHWLNLYHTWGPTNSPGVADNCNYDDLVNDTPNTIGYTSCQLTGASCGSDLDNVQNYMDYSYCSNMFTWGQRQRMRAALTSGIAQRSSLWTQNNLLATGVINPPLCIADFSSESISVCVGDSVQFTDHSYNNVTSWSWAFGDGEILEGSDPAVHQNPQHAYADPGIYNVSLTVSNGSEFVSHTETAFIQVLQGGILSSPLVEGFESNWPAINWINNNPQGDETWEITPTAHYSGTKALKLRNFSIDAGGVDEMYSSTFDMTGADTVFLSYKWAYANRVAETDDRLRISVTGDCGETWSLRKMRKGSTNLPTADPIDTQFTPSTLDQWDGETIVLTNTSWFTDRFRVKFEFTSYGGNNFFLDDINIIGSFSTGVRELPSAFSFNIYPNPSQESMTIDLIQQGNENVTLELYNATGQLCSTLFAGTLSGGRHGIEIPRQSAGMYTVLLKTAGQVAVQKVVFN